MVFAASRFRDALERRPPGFRTAPVLVLFPVAADLGVQHLHLIVPGPVPGAHLPVFDLVLFRRFEHFLQRLRGLADAPGLLILDFDQLFVQNVPQLDKVRRHEILVHRMIRVHQRRHLSGQHVNRLAACGRRYRVFRVQLRQGRFTRHAVRRQPVPALERDHGALGPAAELAVHLAAQIAQVFQPLLQPRHFVALGPHRQDAHGLQFRRRMGRRRSRLFRSFRRAFGPCRKQRAQRQDERRQRDGPTEKHCPLHIHASRF